MNACGGMLLPRDEPEIDQRLIQGLAHPVRVRILEVLQTQTLSPALMARELEVPLGDIAYHVRVLVKNDCLELVRKEPRRGATEHFYRAKPSSFIGSQDLRKVPRAVRSAISWSGLRSFFRRAVAAIHAGVIDDREDTVFTWRTITVDSQGWAEAARALSEADARLGDIHAQSCLRLRERESEGTRVVVGLAGFEAAR
jgi:hypothetical protein